MKLEYWDCPCANQNWRIWAIIKNNLITVRVWWCTLQVQSLVRIHIMNRRCVLCLSENYPIKSLMQRHCVSLHFPFSTSRAPPTGLRGQRQLPMKFLTVFLWTQLLNRRNSSFKRCKEKQKLSRLTWKPNMQGLAVNDLNHCSHVAVTQDFGRSVIDKWSNGGPSTQRDWKTPEISSNLFYITNIRVCTFTYKLQISDMSYHFKMINIIKRRSSVANNRR